jgi:hypothetical protein
MHPSIERAIEEINAALGSSDEFEGEEKQTERDALRQAINRWENQLNVNDSIWGPQSRCHICGGPNH